MDKKDVDKGPSHPYVLAEHLVPTYSCLSVSFPSAPQFETSEEFNWSEAVLKKLHIPNILAEEVPNPPLQYYTCKFRVNKLERYSITPFILIIKNQVIMY